MISSDFWIVFRWWGTLFLVGAAAFPLVKRLFSRWYDQGYLFAKAVGMALTAWIVFVLATAHLASFRPSTTFIALGVVFVLGLIFTSKEHLAPRFGRTLVFEELFFFVALLLWSWVKGHEPSIRGLEKFMDYGFMNSLLHARYFPPTDMWYPPLPINYYYFGHLVTAMLTALSGLDLGYTFNLMLATIFALCLTMSFSIGYQLVHTSSVMTVRKHIVALVGGALTAFLVTLAGNMQTIYAFTMGYTGDNVAPFWKLLWPWRELADRLPEGMARYWYANATRFIPYSIHEFPSYSFVVSDVHGHVLSIPFVLLAIGLLIAWFGQTKEAGGSVLGKWGRLTFYGFLTGVLLMTNALDGPIYLFLFLILLVTSHFRMHMATLKWKDIGISSGVVVLAASITSLPFLAHFSSFVNGVAVDCPPAMFANMKIGPLLFETADKCQKSPLWMMWLLWGFFWFVGLFWITVKIKEKKIEKRLPLWQSIVRVWNTVFTHTEQVLVVCFFFSTLLLIFPEFFYFKDIYPMHFRSNTMFKLGYQAFIMYSIISGYAIIHLFADKKAKWRRLVFFLFFVPQFLLVSIYPYFSIRSYFGELRTYESLYGLSWMAQDAPDDLAGIFWLNSQPRITGETLVEADGDSYTEYERFSVFAGMPTIVGWSVHEWLWRGTYDVVSPRKEEVRELYEGNNDQKSKEIIAKYKVRYIIVASKERERYPNLDEEKLMRLGRMVFERGSTRIYQVTN